MHIFNEHLISIFLVTNSSTLHFEKDWWDKTRALQDIMVYNMIEFAQNLIIVYLTFNSMHAIKHCLA